MKFLMLTLLLFALPLHAQFSHAYDPNYVDFSAKMDTLARFEPAANFNAGLLNADPFEDFYLALGVPQAALLRYGGPLLFDTTSRIAHFTEPLLRGDFDGDGIEDLISQGYTLSNGPLFFRGKKEYPYWDSASGYFTDHYHRPDDEGPLIVGAADVNNDGIADIIGAEGGAGGFQFFNFYGTKTFGDSVSIRGSDSSAYFAGLGWIGATVSNFSSHGNRLLFIACTSTDTNSSHTVTHKIGVLRHLDDLAHDTMVYLSHTTDNVHIYHPGTDSMIAATGIYTMDITGDGIPDLLVTDGVYIYIFKGSDSLGYYPLTKDRAYYRIPHPALLEGLSSDWSYIDQWGFQMFNCGDLTGSGVPVLGVEGRSSTSGDYDAVFFYCGGKALDSLFDGLLQKNAAFDGGYGNLDTLHSIDNSGRSAVLVPVDNLDLLLYRGGDKMPHRTNPQMLVSSDHSKMPDSILLSVYPSIASWGIHVEASLPDGDASLKIFNELGILMQSRSIYGSNNVKEFFNTDDLPNGNYFLELEAQTGIAVQRFMVQKAEGQVGGFQAMQERESIHNWPTVQLGPKEK